MCPLQLNSLHTEHNLIYYSTMTSTDVTEDSPRAAQVPQPSPGATPRSHNVNWCMCVWWCVWCCFLVLLFASLGSRNTRLFFTTLGFTSWPSLAFVGDRREWRCSWSRFGHCQMSPPKKTSERGAGIINPAHNIVFIRSISWLCCSCALTHVYGHVIVPYYTMSYLVSLQLVSLASRCK